jgi:hypothetical protein
MPRSRIDAANSPIRPAIPKPHTTFLGRARPRRVSRASDTPVATPPYIQETTMPTATEAIRALNDELRRNLPCGHAVLTTGIAALGPEAVARIVMTIAVYDDFCHANDPYDEHDFGAFEVDGQTVFFKIDYYDKALTRHSPDPADPSVTERVITVMLAEEY